MLFDTVTLILWNGKKIDESQPSSIHCSRVQYFWCQNYSEIGKTSLKVTQPQKRLFCFVFFEAGGGERGLTRAIQLLPSYCKKIMYLMKRTERKIFFNNQNPLIFTCATLLRNQTKFETSKLISSVVFNKPSWIGLINFCL